MSEYYHWTEYKYEFIPSGNFYPNINMNIFALRIFQLKCNIPFSKHLLRIFGIQNGLIAFLHAFFFYKHQYFSAQPQTDA